MPDWLTPSSTATARLAAAQPYGRLRNFGLGATFMTPVVVLLIDLLAPAGWRLPKNG
jgi:hypothetical protein